MAKRLSRSMHLAGSTSRNAGIYPCLCSSGFFMNHEGYVCQKIRKDGWQMNVEEVLDRDASPSRVMDKDGNQLVVPNSLHEAACLCGLWKMAIGRVPLYLLEKWPKEKVAKSSKEV